MTVSTLSQNGQTTIPVAVRLALGLKPHQKILYQVEGDHVVIEAFDSSTDALYGSLSHAKRSNEPAEKIRKSYLGEKYGRDGKR